MAQWMNFHQNNKSVEEHLQHVANYSEENWACSSADGSYGRWQGDRWADKISADFIISTNQTIQFFTGRVLLQCQHHILVSNL